jgi:hypothetical protein
MRIESSEQIEGIPLARIRSMFRRAGLESTFTLDFVGQQLELTKQHAQRLVAGLRTAGLIEPVRAEFPSGGRQWSLTDEGVRLRCATAAKPLHRATTEDLLAKLLERIELLNADDHFLARVSRAIVFGSYLQSIERLSDVDVAIELVPRCGDRHRLMAANDERVREEQAGGRQFSNLVDQLFWWQREAMLFLRNRKRGLSLQTYGNIRRVVDSSPHRLIFGDEGRP